MTDSVLRYQGSIYSTFGRPATGPPVNRAFFSVFG
jgi:hypothetical protein